MGFWVGGGHGRGRPRRRRGSPGVGSSRCPQLQPLACRVLLPDPDRLRGITILGTLEDPVASVEEIKRAYGDGLRTGIMLPLDYDQPYLHHKRYDMIWDTCQELDLSVITHVSRGHPKWLGDDPWVQRFLYMQEGGWSRSVRCGA